MSKNISPERRQRMDKVLELRIAGATFRQIGKALGISAATAYNDTEDALKEVTRPNAEALLKLENERLDFLLAKTIPLVNTELDVNDLDAVATRLKVLEQRGRIHDRMCRLNRLGADRQEITVAAAAKMQEQFTILDDLPQELLDDA